MMMLIGGAYVGISQRNMNYYEFLNEPETQNKIVSGFVAYWTEHVKPKWNGPASCKEKPTP
jgi:D123